MITLLPQHVDEISRHAEQLYPHECCGLLLGTPEGETGTRVHHVFPVTNAAPAGDRRTRFVISAADLLLGQKRARLQALTVVGCYHSHVDGPAVPSASDGEQAWRGFSYVIVSVAKGQARQVVSFRMDGAHAGFTPEALQEGL